MAITERLSQAVEKAWRIEQLEEANHAYTQMLGFVSHELKSPVASMVTDAQHPRAGLPRRPHARADAPSSRAWPARASTCSTSCASTSTSRASRAASSSCDPRRAWTSAKRSSTRPSSSCAPQLEAHGMQLVTELPRRRPARSSAATPRCCASSSSTCSTTRSSTATRAATIRVNGEVTTARQDRPGRCASGSACGTSGPGFSHGAAATSSSAASRASTTRPSRGAAAPGVGLYNAWRIIQLHKGRITADSKHGEWAEFSFEIPACGGLRRSR